MGDFRIWGRVAQIDTAQFVVIVSSVPANPLQFDQASVVAKIEPTRDEAVTLRDALMCELGAEVRARGDHVVDVEEDQ
jgi:hypothetical protein